MSKAKEILDEAKIEVNDHDRDMIKSNQIKLNKAIQNLDDAMHSFDAIDSSVLHKLAKGHIEKASDLIKTWNKNMVKLGVS